MAKLRNEFPFFENQPQTIAQKNMAQRSDERNFRLI